MSQAAIDQLISAVTAAAPEFGAENVRAALVRSTDLRRADVALPCFLPAKNWRISPPEAAKRLAAALTLPASFSKVEIVGPYLNFFFDRPTLVKNTLPSLLGAGENVGRRPQRDEKILVDYSHPNIAKEFHVGHLRTTLIGLSLVRIFSHLGYETIGINHLGDWGTQFGFVHAGCELWGRPADADVDSLVDVYIKASALRKAQDAGQVPAEDADKPNVNEMARDYFKRLEAGEAAAVEFWRWCLDISMRYFKTMYARLDITFDYYTGESFYQDKMAAVEEELRASGLLEESRGALGVDLGKELGFARIFTEDGRSLYITRDIAAAYYRHKTFNPQRILYVVAHAQSLHFKQLIGVLKRMQHPVAERMVHVAFGFVPGMKTRTGGAISLREYLDEAHERALAAYRQEVTKRPEGLDEEKVAEAVAIGATYFYFLSHSNIKDFNFSWREALNFQGDSGAYVQYALARLYSIEAKARESGIELAASPEALQFQLLVEDEAHELVVLLGQFDAVVDRAAAEYEPSHIAAYVLEIARAFARAYANLRVVGETRELALARLALFRATRLVLRQGLHLIGVPTIERM